MVKFYPTPGMSGGNMLDHRLLVKAMRRLVERHGETIRLAPIPVFDAYLRFEHARATALDSHRHVCVWSAKNRKSLVSTTDEPAGVKIARLNEHRRRDLHVARDGDEGAPPRVKHAGRQLRVAIPESPVRCPIARLRRLIVRLVGVRRLPRQD